MATAELIREARRGKGLTQRALADRLKLGQSALADIERSAHDTRGDQLDRIVNAAGYRLAVLPTSPHRRRLGGFHLRRAPGLAP